MWRKLVRVMVMIVGATAVVTLNAQSEASKLRPENAEIRALIGRGMEGSATFRTLKSRLDDANVIVYVRFSPCWTGVPACLLWASSDTDARRLLIRIDRFGRSRDELTALLAHELQHANEVAADSEIRDLATFERAFALRGRRHAAGFETEAAAEVSRRVAAELSHGENRASLR